MNNKMNKLRRTAFGIQMIGCADEGSASITSAESGRDRKNERITYSNV